MKARLARLLCRLILAGVFLFAAWGKIADPAGFAVMIQGYQMLPGILVNPLAVTLPWIELAAGGLLLAGVWLPGAVAVIDGLLVVFLGALLAAWVRGIDVDCGCFSTTPSGGGSMSWYLVRDLFFLGMGGYLFHGLLRQGR